MTRFAMYKDVFTVPANIAGIPAISIPCGFDRDGLPIGLQLIGKVFDEAHCLKRVCVLKIRISFKKAGAKSERVKHMGI